MKADRRPSRAPAFPGPARSDAAGGRSPPLRFTLLTAAHDRGRNRRASDIVLLAAAALGGALAAVIAASVPGTDEEVGDALGTLLGWAGPLWRVALLGALLLAVVIASDVIWRGRLDLARDVLLAVLVVGAAGAILGGAVAADWAPINAGLWSRWGFPEVRVAWAAAVVTVAAPEIVRPARVLGVWLVGLAALGVLALGAALPSAAVAGLALGLAAAALVRLAFGTAAGIPPVERVREALTALGVDVSDLRVAGHQRLGAAEYVGEDTAGRPLRARVLGRDAQETQRLARRWRSLAYRDPPRSVAIGRLEQVEHEALATLLAARAGVHVPEVVTAALGPEGDAVVVTVQPDAEVLEALDADDVSDETLHSLWEEVALLHAAGISHGRLNASNIAIVDGSPLVLDLSAATLGAPRSALDIDVAELLVACTVIAGPARALAAAIAGIGTDAVTGAAPYLQRAALTPHVRDLARHHEVALKDLREATARATGTEPAKLVELRRVRAQDLVLVGFVIFAAYGLIGKIAEVGPGTLLHQLSGADLAWAAVALVLAQLTMIGGGISVRGSVPTPLPLLPCVVLQAAIRFINLTVPSSAGRIAMNVRFLQRMGASTPEAVASGAVDDVSEKIVKALLVVATLPFVSLDIDTSRFADGGPDARLVVAIAIALAAGVAVMLAVPSLRAKVVPRLRVALDTLGRVARDRHKRLELFGGNLLSELLFALVLGAACRAYGVEPSLAELVFVNTAAGVLSSLIPVPGGIGASEASTAAGLIAIGVDESTAFAIALTKRLCTFYLPPLWGYPALQWLRRKGYV
jgi:glycosyltransferase 2 family protein